MIGVASATASEVDWAVIFLGFAIIAALAVVGFAIARHNHKKHATLATEMTTLKLWVSQIHNKVHEK